MVKFEVDSQTVKDLEIFETFKNQKSVFQLFNRTKSIGGKQKLYEFLSNPLSDLERIVERKEAIEFFQNHLPSGLIVNKNALDFTEYYLRQGNYPTRPPSKFYAIERMIFNKVSDGGEYYLVKEGVSSAIKLLKNIHSFSQLLTSKLAESNCPSLLKRNNDKTIEILSRPEYQEVLESKIVTKAYDTARFDYMFRYTNKRDILFFLGLVHEYDAFWAIVKTAEKYGFAYPEVLPAADNCLEIDGLFHPFLDKPIANDIHFGGESNLLFVSGPNMAGKSTFLKALSVSVYLAHTGLPVPVKSMKISLLSGLCTTINISDDLSSGYSHFYAEVMRIKNVANRLKEHNNMLIIFDELFRGTNVKDAYDGTLGIVSAFSEIRSSFFVISTHIVEVSKELAHNDNIKFCYFEIIDQNQEPKYTYKLKEGISEARLGMYIIEKEKVIELIKSINDKSSNLYIKNETI